MKSSSRREAKSTSINFGVLGPGINCFGKKCWWWIVASLLIAVPADGQTPGTTVQLPSFHNFSYSGSVMVPDSGDAYLGGFGRAGDRTNRYRSGFPGLNTSSLRSMSSAHARVHVIDHSQWDRAVLGGTPEEFLRRRRSDGGRSVYFPADRQAIRATGNAVGVVATRGVKAEGADSNELGKKLVRMGRRAAELGDLHWTRFYYQLAQKNLDARLAKLAQLEYEKQLSKLGVAASF